VNGQATGTLRRLWGLNAILSQGDIDTKNRGDHRHHAIDALVIACTTPSLVHTLSAYSKFDAMGKLKNSRISEELPWKHFLRGVDESINSIIISYRNQKRLVGMRPNKIKTKNLDSHPKGYIIGKNITIRGQLHEETLYGTILQNGEESYVTRWPLERFTDTKQLEKIVDPKVKETLQKRVKRFKGEFKAAFAENSDDPILMYSKKGKHVLIKKIRVLNPTESLIEIRPKTFVESGNNYAIAIYGDYESKKRNFKTISFWEATQSALHGKSIFPNELNGTPLMFVLRQKDTVVFYESHPDEIHWGDIEYLRKNLFRVRKFDVNGIIYLDYLYIADVDNKEDRNRLFFQVNPNTIHCVKVNVDILGRIVQHQGVE